MFPVAIPVLCYLAFGFIVVCVPWLEGAGKVTGWIDGRETGEAVGAALVIVGLLWPLVALGYLVWGLSKFSIGLVDITGQFAKGVRDLVYPPSKKKPKVPQAKVVKK